MRNIDGLLKQNIRVISHATAQAFLDGGTELKIVEAYDRKARAVELNEAGLKKAIIGVAELEPGIAWQVNFTEFGGKDMKQ